MQNRNHHLLLLLLLISLCGARAIRVLSTDHGKDSDVLDLGELQVDDLGNDVWDLMGEEDCKIGDEECLKRRMMAQAHVDYIYTQHHKP